MVVKKTAEVVVGLETIFAQAIMNRNEQTLSDILSDEGRFLIQDGDLNDIEADKIAFIKWILERSEEVDNLSYCFSQCVGCSLGSPILLFNDGKFPRKPKSLEEYIHAGMCLMIANNVIERIIFCNLFLADENQSGFERKREELIECCMKAGNITKEEAIRELNEERNKRLSVDLNDFDELTQSILKKVYPENYHED